MSRLYSRLFLKKEEGNRWLTLIALGVVLLASGIFVVFPLDKKRLRIKASDIEFVMLSNLSSSQVTIVWKTREAKDSSILYGESPERLVKEVEDELKIISGKASVYHYATLQGLKPSRDYYFVIKVDNKLVGKGDVPFRVRTPSQFLPSQKPPLVGKIIGKTGKPEEGKILILQIEGAYPLSTLTSEEGEWVIPLSLVFDKEGKRKVELSGKEKFELKVLGLDLVATGTLESFMEYSLPLKAGKEYFFEKKTGSKNPQDIKKIADNRNYRVMLTYPKQGATISSARPLIKGKGVPFEEVLVEIESKKRIILKAIVDEEGDWQVSLPFKLPPGRHIINVFTKNSQGDSVEIVRDFYIAKSGESVLSAATPSADLTVSPEPSPTPTFSFSPTPTPTKILSTTTPTPPVAGFDPKYVFLISALFLVPGVLLLLK